VLGELRPFCAGLSFAVPLALRSNSAAGEFGQDVAEVIERQHLVKIAGQQTVFPKIVLYN